MQKRRSTADGLATSSTTTTRCSLRWCRAQPCRAEPPSVSWGLSRSPLPWPTHTMQLLQRADSIRITTNTLLTAGRRPEPPRHHQALPTSPPAYPARRAPPGGPVPHFPEGSPARCGPRQVGATPHGGWDTLCSSLQSGQGDCSAPIYEAGSGARITACSVVQARAGAKPPGSPASEPQCRQPLGNAAGCWLLGFCVSLWVSAPVVAGEKALLCLCSCFCNTVNQVNPERVTKVCAVVLALCRKPCSYFIQILILIFYCVYIITNFYALCICHMQFYLTLPWVLPQLLPVFFTKPDHSFPSNT